VLRSLSIIRRCLRNINSLGPKIKALEMGLEKKGIWYFLGNGWNDFD
jgi:hypothetical protein